MIFWWFQGNKSWLRPQFDTLFIVRFETLIIFSTQDADKKILLSTQVFLGLISLSDITSSPKSTEVTTKLMPTIKWYQNIGHSYIVVSRNIQTLFFLWDKECVLDKINANIAENS